MKKILGFLIVVALALAVLSWSIHLQRCRLEGILEKLQKSEQRLHQIDQTLDQFEQQFKKGK